MRRSLVVIVLALLGLTLLTACDNPGTVESRTWKTLPGGVRMCDLSIDPDPGPADLDKDDVKNFTMKDQTEKRCNACPPGARWPRCAMPNEQREREDKKREEKRPQPDPPQNTIPWNPGGDGERPVREKGAACAPEGAPAKTSGGTPMRCRDGKWQLS